MVVVRLLLRDSARSDPDKAQAIDALVARGAVVVAGDVTDPQIVSGRPAAPWQGERPIDVSSW
jgi:hypothetical protein